MYKLYIIFDKEAKIKIKKKILKIRTSRHAKYQKRDRPTETVEQHFIN